MNISEHFKILINYYQSKQYKKVIEVCEKILKENVNLPEIYNFYGLALQNLKKNKQAINYFNQSILLQSKDCSVFNNLGNSYKFLFLNKYAYKNF